MKTAIRTLLILISAFCILMNIGPVIVSGEKNIGIIVGLGSGALFLAYAIFFDKINAFFASILSSAAGKIIFSIIAAAAAFAVIIGSVTLINIMRYSRQAEKRTEYIIVLGCRVNGTQPGRYLRARINKALEYLNENPGSSAILSGGQGADEDISEGQAMFDSLTASGIDPSRLIIEDKSTSTIENFENSINAVRSGGKEIDEIIIITNDFHEYRASRIAARLGIPAYPYPAKTPWDGYLPFAVREVFAVVYQIYLGRNNLRN